VDRHDVADEVEACKAHGPFHTSARTGENVEELFSAVAQVCVTRAKARMSQQETIKLNEERRQKAQGKKKSSCCSR